MKTVSDRKILLFLSVTGLLLFVLIWHFRWFPTFKEGNHLNDVIRSDGQGYYSYLPDIFISKDFGKEKPKRFYEVETREKKVVNKYTYGTALLESPFFFAACAIVKLFDLPAHGYSETFHIAITLSGLFYFLAGLYLLAKIILMMFPGIRKDLLYFLAVFTFGSFVIYYVVILPSFSHVYSFFLINLFFYFLLRWKDNFSIRYLIFLSLTSGIIFITRPVNILVIFFVPFFFANANELLLVLKREILRANKIPVLLVSGFIPVFIQMVLWYIQTGSFFYWSYKGEGFYFNDPEIFNFLFSFRKGFFIYSPVFLLLFPAWIYLFRSDKWKFIISFLFFILVTYIFSSWYNWFYADSFGMRPMVDLTGLFMVIIACLLVNASGYKKILIRYYTGICIFINLIFSWQFYQGIIHFNTMDAKKFGMIFLKTGKSYYNYFGGMKDSPPYAPGGYKTVLEKHEDFLSDSGQYRECDGNEFPFGWEIPVNHELAEDEILMVELDFIHRIEEDSAGNDLHFVIHGSRNDSTVYYYAVRAKEFPVEKSGEWIKDKLIFSFVNIFLEGDKAGFYFWNKNKENIHIDAINLKISTPLN